jgi:hypothetical protein
MTFTERVEFVRSTFFPRWDRKRRWQFAEVDDLDGSQGRCDREVKTIRILAGMATGDELLALVIHEIGHAASNDYHGGRWLRTMEAAAEIADAKGLAAIASLLRQQISGYRDGFRMTAAMIYGEVENCVVGAPQITFPQVVDFLRRGYGMSQDQFLRRFRRAERVFEKAQQEARESADAKAKWTAYHAGVGRLSKERFACPCAKESNVVQ